MTRDEILELEDKVITLEQLEAIEESPVVESVENLGNNSICPHLLWFVITFKGGEEISVFL